MEEDLVSLFEASSSGESLMRRNRERAFVSNEFKDYNPRVEHHVSKFIDVIRKTDGKEVNVEKLLENLVFDM